MTTVDSTDARGSWSTPDLRVAVERELDALGPPERCETRATLGDILTFPCGLDQLIARYLWAAMAVHSTLSRDHLVADLERSAIDAKERAGKVGDPPDTSMGTPAEILSALDRGPLHGAAASRLDGIPVDAAATFFVEAMALAGRLVTPLAGLESDLNAALAAHDAVATIVSADTEGLPRSADVAITSALFSATMLSGADGPEADPAVTAEDGVNGLYAEIARLCVVAVPSDDETGAADSATWQAVERRTADRLALIRPGMATSQEFGTAIYEALTLMLTPGSSDEDARDLRDELVDVAALAGAALALGARKRTGDA